MTAQGQRNRIKTYKIVILIQRGYGAPKICSPGMFTLFFMFSSVDVINISLFRHISYSILEFYLSVSPSRVDTCILIALLSCIFCEWKLLPQMEKRRNYLLARSWFSLHVQTRPMVRLLRQVCECAEKFSYNLTV